MYRTFAIVLFFTFQYYTLAQVPSAFHLSSSNGLPSLNVFSVCQDAQGFLQIATENGLCRYDGNNITITDIRGGLPDNSVIHVSKGFNGNLWVCTYNRGMRILNNSAVYTESDSLRLADSQILKVVHTKKKVWLLNSHRHLYTLEKGLFKLFKVENDTPLCKNILSINDSTCVLNTTLGLFIDEGANGVQKIYLPLKEKVQLYFPYAKNRTIALFENQIMILNKYSIVKHIKLKEKYIWNDIVKDSKGNIWIATNNGLMKIDSDGKLVRFPNLFSRQPTVINDLYVDSWDNVWLATYGAGIYCLWNNNITYILPSSEKVYHNVTSLCSNGDEVFSSSFGGLLTKWQNQNGTQLRLPCNETDDYSYFTLVQGDTLLLGKNSGICYLSNLSDTTISHCMCEHNSEGALCGYYDSNGYLWVGRYEGVTYQKNGKKEKINSPHLLGNRVNAICEYAKGKYYLGTGNGLFKCTAKEVVPIFFTQRKEALFVTTLKIDRYGNLWIGTRGGLFIKRKGSNTIHSFDHVFLSHTKISKIIEDKRGTIWIGSYQGVYKFSNRELVAYTRQNGLLSNHVLSLTVTNKNKVWVGSPDGISIINASQETIPTKAPSRIYITEAIFNNKVYPFPKKLTFKSSTRNIIINITSIYLPTSEQIKYQYRIKKLAEDWQELPNQSLVLSSLPKGKYILEVRSLKISENVPSQQVTLVMNVVPLFYEKQSFIILVTLAIIVLVVVLIQFRITYIKNKEKVKNWKKLRTMFLRLQFVQASLNPHFIFNSLNSILALLKTNRKEQAENYLSGFSKLLRATLETVGSTTISLDKEIEKLKQYLELEKIRFSDAFDYTIEVSNEVQIKRQKIPIMVLQPFVENAIKHGIRNLEYKGLIKISLKRENDNLKITIEDNGIGYETSLAQKKQEGTHKSLGIKMVERELRLLSEVKKKKYSFTINQKNQGIGTVVTIHIPWV
jgi:ligand-binding sensor domain-containing protein/two-component sensor histidine kinase